MTVAIPGGEIHRGINVGRILAQGLLHNAHRLDELAPVHGGQEPQAADAVAHRHLVGRLLPVFRAHQLFDGRSGLAQPLLNPGERKCQGRTLALETACELGNKGAGQGRIGACHIGDRQNQAFGILYGNRRHLVGPVGGAVSLDSAGGDPGGRPSQILDQGQAQHDGNGPQFAKFQGGHRLVGGHEAAEVFRIHPAVAVRDCLQRDVVHPWQAGRWAIEQPRQLTTIIFGQVSPGHANLLFDQIEIVNQPFPGRGNPVVGFDSLCQQIAGFNQDAFIFGQTCKEPIRGAS
jgi:hypothetical protein